MTYNRTSPFFDHVQRKGKKGTIRVDICAWITVIIAPFLLEEHAKVSQLLLQICHSTGLSLILWWHVIVEKADFVMEIHTSPSLLLANELSSSSPAFHYLQQSNDFQNWCLSRLTTCAQEFQITFMSTMILILSGSDSARLATISQ